MSMVDLDAPGTQDQIGELVGVTRQAISEMEGRGVMARGISLRASLLAYCNHMRLMAAGRDGDLARERAELTRVQKERQLIKLKLEQSEIAPVDLIEQVFSTIGRRVAGKLEPLPGQIAKLCPELTPAALVKLQKAISEACDQAVAASLDVLAEGEEEGAEPVEELMGDDDETA